MRSRELIQIASNFRRGILKGRTSAGMCMAVSAPLQGLLSAVYGVETDLEEVWFNETPQGTTNHVFLRLPDGRILDPTADQFGLPPVYLGQMPELYREWMEEKNVVTE